MDKRKLEKGKKTAIIESKSRFYYQDSIKKSFFVIFLLCQLWL